MKQVTNWATIPVIFDLPLLCCLLGVTPQTVYRWMKAGIIPHHHLGSSLRFYRDEIEEWLKAS